MKILFISRLISPPWTEGVKNIIKGLIENINNHKFIILTRKGYSFKKNNVQEIIISDKIEKFKVPIKNKLNFFKKIISENNADVYHLFFMPKYYSSILIKILSRLKKRKTIQTITNTYNRLDKKLYFADKIIVMSNYSKEKLKSIGIKSETIYPGIDPKKFKNITDYKKGFKLTKNKTVLYAGDLSDIKTINNLVNIIKESSSKLKEIKFIIAVRGKNKLEINNKKFLIRKTKELGLNNNILFLGHVYDMPRLIKTCDLVIFPTTKIESKLEIPMILLESLALGKPILISKIYPLNELLTKEAGFLLNPKDPREFSEKLIELLKKKRLTNKLSKNGPKIIEEKFNIKKIAKQYQKIYDTI